MGFNIYLFLFQYIIFINEYEFINGKPLIGINVLQTQPGDFPYLVSLMLIEPGTPHSGGTHFCSGVLITPSNVLTSAHCVEDEQLNHVQMVVGTIDLRNGTVMYPFWWMTFDQWCIASNTSIDFDTNDIANVRLTNDVPHRIVPIRMSRSSTPSLYGEEVLMVGWGDNNQGITPDILNVAATRVIPNIDCHSRLHSIIGISVSPVLDIRMICTFIAPYALLANGDSGGPLIHQNKLVGINKANCPGDRIPDNDIQMNLHIGINGYRTYIRHMKYS